jgi:hypothetical protein
MTFAAYQSYFESLLQKEASEQSGPYTNPDYLDYTRLNWSRMNRWFKTTSLSEELTLTLGEIASPQEWIIITEPWCGDAAHNIPFLEMATRVQPMIHTSYVLRDTEPFLIEQYLTNGTKSIPKLIIRDRHDNDLATWGPRPANCQVVYQQLLEKKADFEEIKTAIQNWYNQNKGQDMMAELNSLLKSLIHAA